jgi:hypothetical protein
MKSLQKWGVAFWLVVLLCVPWSMAEAGRPVYLSEYLDFQVGPDDYWILSLNCEYPQPNSGELIPAIKIILKYSVSSTDPFEETWKFFYSGGNLTYDDEQHDLRFINGDNVDLPLFSYTSDSYGFVSFNYVLAKSIDGCVPLNDRQPTDKMIELNSNYDMRLDLPRTPYGSNTEYCLKISFIEGWSGVHKDIPTTSPFCELYMGEDILVEPGPKACKLGTEFYEFRSSYALLD